jgi:hypothetical protein
MRKHLNRSLVLCLCGRTQQKQRWGDRFIQHTLYEVSVTWYFSICVARDFVVSSSRPYMHMVIHKNPARWICNLQIQNADDISPHLTIPSNFITRSLLTYYLLTLTIYDRQMDVRLEWTHNVNHLIHLSWSDSWTWNQKIIIHSIRYHSQQFCISPSIQKSFPWLDCRIDTKSDRCGWSKRFSCSSFDTKITMSVRAFKGENHFKNWLVVWNQVPKGNRYVSPLPLLNIHPNVVSVPTSQAVFVTLPSQSIPSTTTHTHFGLLARSIRQVCQSFKS